MSFVGMIAGQIGTVFAVRTRRASLRSIGVTNNRYLLLAIACVVVFAALFVYAPPLQSLLATAALPARDVPFLLPYEIRHDEGEHRLRSFYVAWSPPRACRPD